MSVPIHFLKRALWMIGKWIGELGPKEKQNES